MFFFLLIVFLSSSRLSNRYVASKLRRIVESVSAPAASSGSGSGSAEGKDEGLRAGEAPGAAGLPLLRDLRASRSGRDPGTQRVLVDFSSPNIAKEMHVVGCISRKH
jgi:hypothetical protein